MGRLDHIWQFKDMGSVMPCKYYHTRYPIIEGKGWRHIRSIFRELLVIPMIVWKGIQIVRKEKIDLLFAVTDREMEIAALFIHWATRKPLYIYMPDLYFVRSRKAPGWTTLLQRITEPILVRVAKSIFVCSKPTCEYYQLKYGRHTELIQHSTDFSAYSPEPPCSKKPQEYFNIVFTGEASAAQLDAILNMVKVVNEFPDLKVKFTVYSNNSPKYLKEFGINGPNVECKQATRKEIPLIQQSADILFLPLAFEWDCPEIIRTASPSKLPEYLVAGRPILVHAPGYSYVAVYGREEGFALVVDRPDIELLRQAILQLKTDGVLCERIVANALRVAKQHHDAARVSMQLQRYMGLYDDQSQSNSLIEVLS
ncbi:MAG: hypothetical protein NTX75_03840 [Proteobacteria bacterium]|nr:hypothetical protein [Pseudomonadota bacterium]